MITPWFAAYPSRYTNGDPVTAAAVPTPILTANEVKLLFSVITKLPLNLTASLVNPTNLILEIQFMIELFHLDLLFWVLLLQEHLLQESLILEMH